MVNSLYLLRMSCVSDQRVGFLQSPHIVVRERSRLNPKLSTPPYNLDLLRCAKELNSVVRVRPKRVRSQATFPPQDVWAAMVGIVLKQLVQQQFG